MKMRNLFATITKVDAVEGLVFGRLTEEIEDKSGETLDYALSKPLFEAWSGEAAKATDGKSLGNLREMHQLKAVGKLTAIDFFDEEKAIDICAKVVDQEALDKCIEGVYTGFSVGGKLVKRWKDGEATKIVIGPSEASLVDNPCVQTAHFSYIKAAGADPEERAFKLWSPTAPEIAAKAAALATEEGEGITWQDRVEEARAALLKAHSDEAVGAEIEEEGDAESTEAEKALAAEITAAIKAAHPDLGDEGVAAAVKAIQPTITDALPLDEAVKAWKPEPAAAEKAEAPEWAQVWQARDGKTFAKKADVITYAGKLRAGGPLADALKATGDQDAAPEMVPWPRVPELGRAVEAFKVVRESFAENVVIKGLYSVARLASLIEELGWLVTSCGYETEIEGDDSTLPANLAEDLKSLCTCLVQMAQEETAELIASLAGQGIAVETFDGDVGVIVEMAEGAQVIKASESVYKAGSRNSKADQDRLQAAHDAVAACGADCDPDNLPETEKEKAAGGESYQALVAENDARKADGEKAAAELTTLKATVEEMGAKLAALADSPAPDTRLVHKGGAGAGASHDEVLEVMKSMSPTDLAELAIKAAQRRPVEIHGPARS